MNISMNKAEAQAYAMSVNKELIDVLVLIKLECDKGNFVYEHPLPISDNTVIGLRLMHYYVEKTEFTTTINWQY